MGVQAMTEPSKNNATIANTIDPAKPLKNELSKQELDKVAGGEVTFEYGGLQIRYEQQKADGSLKGT
jgi:hypothetical protein